MDHHSEWTMSISREEFLRLLPGAVGAPAEAEGSSFFRGGDGSRHHWTLRLVPLEELRLGSVMLPRYRIELHLKGYSKAEAEAFLTRFHRGFQRGGG